LGEQMFEDEVGNYLGILETRPYMRARLGLAQCLEITGKTDEAVAHYYEMLRLNPNDNQGVRDSLLSCLLDINRDKEAEGLLKRYKDDKCMARWRYARALLTFRQKGDTATARRQLQEAVDVNDHVLEYLIGDAELPLAPPSSYALGSEDEAIICAAEMMNAWASTPGAVEWLERRA
jgi:tetratricopeptide (TPR) repeat protein